MTILPCPFCGRVPECAEERYFWLSPDLKYGAVSCCCTGPDVRTGYRPFAEWRDAAIEAWNKRAPADVEDETRL